MKLQHEEHAKTDEKRGEKRNRVDTSLVYDERACSKCMQLEKENKNILNEAEELKSKIERLSDELNKKEELLRQADSELSDLKKQTVSQTESQTSNQVSSLQKVIKKKTEDYELLKQLVLDRDRKIKKLEEANKKEISNLHLDKKSSEDTLARLTDENTKLKDKEPTLIEVFTTMKELMSSEKEVANIAPSDTRNSKSCHSSAQ